MITSEIFKAYFKFFKDARIHLPTHLRKQENLTYFFRSTLMHKIPGVLTVCEVNRDEKFL